MHCCQNQKYNLMRQTVICKCRFAQYPLLQEGERRRKGAKATFSRKWNGTKARRMRAKVKSEHLIGTIKCFCDAKGESLICQFLFFANYWLTMFYDELYRSLHVILCIQNLGFELASWNLTQFIISKINF